VDDEALALAVSVVVTVVVVAGSGEPTTTDARQRVDRVRRALALAVHGERAAQHVLAKLVAVEVRGPVLDP
jgi:hypothetical protein